jgi:signal transduction histidine kinase
VPKEKILIADDEQDVLALCVRIMASEGYDVTGVSDGREAIKAAKKDCFDLLLTDIMMPGIKGLDVARVIRETQPDLVCVVMTGFGTMDTAIQALQLGFSEFVVKPFKPDDLKLRVNRALEKERLRRENARLNALVPLFELNKTLMTTVEEDDLTEKVLYAACNELRADLGILMLRGRDGCLHIKASAGFDIEQASSEAVNLLLRIAQDYLEAREQVLVQSSAYPDARVSELMRKMDMQSFLFSPLLSMDVPVGTLILAKSGVNAQFAPGDSELLSVFCGQAAIALENARLFEQIQRAYQELQKLDHMKSEFINIAAHELRTPLAILMGHTDLLQEDVQDAKIKERLEVILRNALRLRELIDALLNMRHLQTGEGPIQFVALDPEELILEVLQDLRLMAEEKDIQVAVSVPSDLMPIETDRQSMLLTLTNLIKNAVEFTPPGGQVGVEVSGQGEEVWVLVWDTGIGIAEDEHEKIFKPFYQVEDSLTREHEGIGLGLAIAKGMVERCHGRIWVESEAGKGSRFTFTLPKQ